ncbi:MAG: hypothetical protein NTY35_10565 [Planctomycetota bacterium]|nr:hypothetical protein [Planctomycetota bacterium]
MADLRIQGGTVRVLVAYDIGLSIRLEACRAHVGGLEADERIRHKGHAPQYFQFDPPPLRLVREVEPIEVGGRRTSATVEILLYEFGGVSVGYTIPFTGTLSEMIELSCVLAGEPRLETHAEALVAHLLTLIRDHVDQPGLAEPEEDFLVFQVPGFEGGGDAEAILNAHAADFARLLRSERGAPSDQEVQEALSGRVRFGADDLAVLDWNAALLVDREPEDVVSVLEFANLQLLEMRFLDAKLDRSLDRAYESLQAPRLWSALRLPGAARKEMRRVAQMQVDGAILFERVSNALKLLGDQYLARVHRTATQRFRLNEWNSGILRKLDTLDSIYQKIHDHSATQRMEALEWIIIVLIAFSMVMPFVGLGAK